MQPFKWDDVDCGLYMVNAIFQKVKVEERSVIEY